MAARLAGLSSLIHLSGHITEELSLSERRAGKKSAVSGRGRHGTGCEQPMGLAALLLVLNLLTAVTCGCKHLAIGEGFFYVDSLPWAQ